MAEEEQIDIPTEENTETIDLREEPEVEDKGLQQADTAKGRKAQRKQLFAELDTLNEKIANYEKREGEWSQQRGRFETELARLQGQVQALSQQATHSQEESPSQKEIKSVQTEEENLLMEFNGLPAQEQDGRRAEYREKFRNIEAKKIAAYVRAALPQQRQGGMSEQDVQQMMLKAQYPTLARDPRAWAWAGSRYQQYLLEGQQGGRDLEARVAQEAMERYKLASPPDPTMEDRRRHTSISRGGREASARKKDTFVMTDTYKQMADVAYSHIKDDRERWATWAREVGQNLPDKQT